MWHAALLGQEVANVEDHLDVLQVVVRGTCMTMNIDPKWTC